MKLKPALDRIAARYGISELDMPALKARIKQLQRMGWPYGANTGRGSSDTWDERKLRDVILVSDLRHLGITAQPAIEIVKANYDELVKAYESKECCIITPEPPSGKPVRSHIVLDFTDLP